MKFIHIADIHLGAKPDKEKPWRKERERHNWRALSEVIRTAKAEQVQLLLIAGDLFHRQPLIQELREIDYQFSRIPQTRVVVIAGEHDYLSPHSGYLTFPWGENVHFLTKEKIDYVELEGLETRVYGLSYCHKNIDAPLYHDIEIKDDNFCNILLAHGGDEQHIPFESNDFADSAFDYVALGHIHKPMEIVKNKVVMAGTLQPIDCNDTGEHGYFMGEIKDGECQVQFVPLRYCEYVPLNLKVSREISQSALEEFVASRIRVAPEHQKFRIVLNGFCDRTAPVDPEKIMSMDRVARVINRCHADYDFEKLKLQYEKQILGQYIQKLEEMTQDEITKKALYYGVEALMEE